MTGHASTLLHDLSRLRGGDDEAARRLLDRSSERLVRLADQRLHRRLAGRVGGEDVVQSVFRTFCARQARGEFRFGDANDLWQLLVHITLTKVREQARPHMAAKRDVRAETSPADDHWLSTALSREPGPAEAATLVEEIEAVLDGLPERYAEILALRLEGHTRTEVARRLGISRQTVMRALNLMQERLESRIRE